MDRSEFVATHCYLCSCIDCPQTDDALLNCYKKVIKNEQTQEKETKKEAGAVCYQFCKLLS